ncbi:MAG: hypothetical protein ACHBNF_11905 [Chromatiales bacterium]
MAKAATKRFSADIIKRRAVAFERYARWQAQAPNRCDPATALSGLGTLYELLPGESRSRPVDVSGVRVLHQRLQVLSKALAKDP